MSKTVVGLLESAAIIGVSFLGGPIGAALGVSSQIGAAIGVAAVGLIETGLNAIIYGGQHQAPEQTETAIKAPMPARVSCYGRARAQGGFHL